MYVIVQTIESINYIQISIKMHIDIYKEIYQRFLAL